MPQKPLLSPSDLAALRKAYAEGRTPSTLAKDFARLRLDAHQISKLAHRQGWGRLRKLAENIATANEREIMRSVLGARREEFAGIVEAMADSFVIDAEKLRDAWGMVENAGDASSLMRAKKLFAERFLSLHGLDRPDPAESANSRPSLNVIFATFDDIAPKNVTPTNPNPDAYEAD